MNTRFGRARAYIDRRAGDISRIRELVLRGIMVFCSVAGAPVVAVGVYEALVFGQYRAFPIYLAAYLPVLLSTVFSRHIPYRIRVGILIGALLVVAGQNFALWGLAGVAVPTVIVASVLSTALLGVTGGAVALAVGLVPMGVFGGLMCTGEIAVTTDVLEMSSNPVSWVTALVVVLLYSGAASVSFGLIYRNLRTALARERRSSAALDRSVAELHERVRLEELVNRISARFVKLEHIDIGAEVEEALTELAPELGVDHAVVVFHAVEGGGTERFIEWVREGCTPYGGEDDVSGVDRRLAARIASGEEIILQGYPGRDEDGGDRSGRADVGSRPAIVALPFRYGSDVIGYVYADASKFSEWEAGHVALLRMLANVFTNVAVGMRERAETERVEAELHQAQRLESVGRLAGGMAHDFNNLLTVILGNSEMAFEAAGRHGEAARHIHDIRHAAERASSLTTQLLAYSRRQVLVPEVFPVNEAITSVHAMLRRIIGEDVAIETHLSPENPHIRVDRARFEQIIMNLATNARDAMPDGGTFSVGSHAVTIGEGRRDVAREIAPGRYVVLEVADSGVGMDRATSERIFDPFFTTKPIGRGTGLGLASVYGTVTQSDGYISVSSRPGEGTTFSIYLPSRLPAATPDSGPDADEAEGC